MTYIMNADGQAKPMTDRERRVFIARSAISAHLRQMWVTLPAPANRNHAPMRAA